MTEAKEANQEIQDIKYDLKSFFFFQIVSTQCEANVLLLCL